MRYLFSGQWILFLLLILLFLWVDHYHNPPSPKSESTEASEFSAERAFVHVAAIADEPHPAGTPQADAVRDYIIQQIESLGLAPILQETTVYRKPVTYATVHNVLARLKGCSTRGDAVALMAHYDSVAFGPGAADDAAGVAALLETMRALSGTSPLFNDVIFIFTDGEEGRLLEGYGLRGAHAFAEQHPWMENVKVILNFDARGVQGPSYVYQTSGQSNAWLIQQLAASRCKASATSLMPDIYRNMPVGSDLTAFISRDVPGYDFAFIHGLEKYHTSLDSPKNLSLASLQHHGEYALHLTRHLATQDLRKIDNNAGNLVYFDIPVVGVLYYSQEAATGFIFIILTIYSLLLWFGLRSGEIDARHFILAFITLCAWVIFCVAASTGIMALVYKLHNVYMLYQSQALTWGIFSLFVGATLLVFNRIMDNHGIYSTWAAFLLPWLIFACSVLYMVPGATYLFTWPVTAGMVPFAWGLIGREKHLTISPKTAIGLALSALPIMFFMVGTLKGLYAALLFVFVGAQLLLLLLTLALLIPHIRILTSRYRRKIASASMIIGILLVGYGMGGVRFSEKYPKFNSLTYALDQDTGLAYYLSCDERPDEWTAQFFPTTAKKQSIREFIPIAKRDYLKSPAPVLALQTPLLRLNQEYLTNTSRTLYLTLDSPRGAEVLQVYAEPGTQVLSASVNGIPMEVSDGPWHISYSIYRGGGVQLELEVPLDSPAEFRVADHKYFLESLLEVSPRPSQYAPKPNTIDFNRDPLKSEESIVVKTFAFPRNDK